MTKTTFELVEADSDPREVAWHNLREADKALDIKMVGNAIIGYMHAHGGATYQDLEAELRKREFSTYLIAKQPSVAIRENGPVSLAVVRGPEKTHPYVDEDLHLELFLSVRPRPHALNDLLEEWSSYEENFKGLRFAGCMVLRNETEIKKELPNLKMFTKDERADLSKLVMNKARVRYVELSPAEAMNNLRTKISAELEIPEKDISLKNVGTYEGVPMYALMQNGKVCGKLGIAKYPTGSKLVQWCY